MTARQHGPEVGQDGDAPHPGSTRKTVDLSIGDAFRVQVSLRPTPPVVVATALLAAAVLVPAVWLLRSRVAAGRRPIDLEATARSWG